MRPAVAIDPASFWLLDGSETSSGAYKIVSDAIDWLKSAQDHAEHYYIDEESLLSLYDQNLIPSDSHIHTQLVAAGLTDVISPTELSKLIHGVLNGCIVIGRDLPFACVHRLVSRAPDPFAALNRQSLRELSSNSATSCSVALASADVKFAYCYPRLSTPRIEMEDVIDIELVEPCSDLVKDGARFSTARPVLQNLDEIYGLADPIFCWRSSKSAADLKFALDSYSFQNGSPPGSLRRYSFGQHFLSSLQKNGGIDGGLESNIVNKCFLVLCNYHGLGISDFRTTSNQSSPPRVRTGDGGVAKRIHVTSSSEGFRLMFWELPDGSVEFANIGPKFEEVIL